MLFLPKWSQNVSKFIHVYKWTAIFKLDINFQFFTNFYISEMFLPISQNVENRNGNGRNSKTKHRIDTVFGTDAK